MPWSEWIQPDDQTAPAFRRLVARDDAGDPGLISFGTDVSFWIGSGLQWNAAQFRSGFPDRAPKPYPLIVMTEGVDFDAIPGSDPADPFRFVEYEDTTETWLSWTWDNGYPEILTTLNAPDSGFVSIVSPTDYDDVDSLPFTPGFQGGGIPTKPVGSVFDTFTGTEPDGTVLANPGDPGGVEAFTIVAEFNAPEPDDDRVYFLIPDPVAHYRPSRFRYWIPGGAPLRLIQRGDGLGMGSGRLFGSGTRQSSTRVLGAL